MTNKASETRNRIFGEDNGLTRVYRLLGDASPFSHHVTPLTVATAAAVIVTPILVAAVRISNGISRDRSRIQILFQSHSLSGIISQNTSGLIILRSTQIGQINLGLKMSILSLKSVNLLLVHLVQNSLGLSLSSSQNITNAISRKLMIAVISLP